MDIQYLGHSCFKLKGKRSSVVIDPYSKNVGWSLPKVSADLVLVTHDHDDHNNTRAITGTARRRSPFIISEPGEYEVEGVSVFGYETYHDNSGGDERGKNIVYRIQIDDINLVHLGDLGHELDKKIINDFGNVDVVMIPMGGVYTIDASVGFKLASEIDASIIIPMHYRTSNHNPDVFGQMATLNDILREYGGQVKEVDDKLVVSKLSLSSDVTEVVVYKDWLS